MPDLIAMATVMPQFFMMVFVVNYWRGAALPFSVVTVAFLALASIWLVWHQKEFSPVAKRWATLTVRSIVVGTAFFAVDLLIAVAHGKANPFHFPGGLLGLPLTFLICPGCTIVCLAGFVRAIYRSRGMEGKDLAD